MAVPQNLIINTGRPNDGTGDDLRSAFEKVNSAVAALWTESAVNAVTETGSGAALYNERVGNNLSFKTLKSDDLSVGITEEGVGDARYINLTALASLSADLTPALGGNLDLAGKDIVNSGPDISNIASDITINGVKILDIISVISLMLQSNTASLNFGTLLVPATNTVNLGEFSNPAVLDLDFGTLVPI